MDKWGKFLFSTPKRTMWTMLGILILIAMVSPNTIKEALENLIIALEPLVAMAITVFVIVTIIKAVIKKIMK